MLQSWKKIIIFIFIFCAIIFINSSLTYAQKKTVKILGITVKGNQTTDSDIIKMTAGLQDGQEVTGDQIQNSIKQLWGLGIFSDIQLYLDREVGDGVFLLLQLKEFPRLGSFSFTGNKKIKDKKFREDLDLYPGQIVSPSQILKTKRKIKSMYEDKGYLLATVSADSLPGERKNRIKLIFTIDEGKKVKVKNIRFTGNKFFDDGKLRKQLKDTKEDKWWWFGGDFNRKKYDDDLEKLTTFYHKNGFRDMEVLSDSIYYDDLRENMFINIKLREGVRYRIRKITWAGNKLFKKEFLANALSLKEGDYYNQESLQKDVSEKLGSLYYDRGYIFAQVQPQEIPVSENQLDIHFQITEGNPVTVRKILVEDNTKTKEKVIRRELRILPGDTFSRAALMRSHREVFILNYFSNVTPDVKPVNDKEVDLVFKVEEKSTDQANMSAGWSERDRMIGSVGIGMNNLFGNGQRLNFDWTFGRFYRNFQIGFTEPWLFDSPTLAGFSFYDTKRDAYYIGYKQESKGFSLQLGRRMRWPDNYFRSDLIYRLDQTSLSNFSSYILERNPNGIASENWPLTSSSVTYVLSRDSRDRPEFPTMGSQFSLTTEFAGTILGGNVDYHKHLFSFKGFYPMFWKFVLYSDTEIGYLAGFSATSQIPYLELFFIGGAGLSRSIPLRGYDDPLAGGRAISNGGRTLLKQSIEFRMPFIDNPTAFGILFAEAGNIWPNLSDTDPFNLRRSVGAGVRIFMPMIGMLGFDYAYGFDNFDSLGRRYGKWKPHFVFGRGF
ncbi:MAG TPA: outer membrane protein assembly factor BamA [Bacteroidetes bacterium]|nr:outer membrane protein assembly factor BamA [Bacteroidota bacterium]